MQTNYLCVLIHIWIKGEVGAPLNRFKSSSKIFYWPFQGGTSFVDLLGLCSVLCLLCLCARLFNSALWSPTGKGLTSWLSFVVSDCEFVTFPLVSWAGVVLYCIDSWSLHPYLLTECHKCICYHSIQYFEVLRQNIWTEEYAMASNKKATDTRVKEKENNEQSADTISVSKAGFDLVLILCQRHNIVQ